MKNRSLGFILLTVLSLFFFILWLSFFVLYVLGNFKGFLDSNQIFILRLSLYFAIILFMLSVFSFFVNLYLVVIKRRFILIFPLFLYAFFILIAMASVVFNTTIIVIS